MLAKQKNATLANDQELEELLLTDGKAPPEPNLPPEVAHHIGEQLRSFYGQLMNEPIPDHLVQLILSLDRNKSTHHGD